MLSSTPLFLFFLFTDPENNGEPKTFASRSKLHRHLLSHQAKDRQIRCKKCSALFLSTLAEITHNCKRQRVLLFHCPICQYNCNKAVALKSHMLTHQTQKGLFINYEGLRIWVYLLIYFAFRAY